MVDRFIQDITSIYLPHTINKQNVEIQIGARPIVPYEFVIPEKHLEFLLKLIQPQEPWNKAYNKYMYLLRKGMKLEPIPELKFNIHEV